MFIRPVMAALGVGAPTGVVAWIMGAEGGGAEAVLYGVPAAAVVGFLSMVYKLLWNALEEERRGRDTDRAAHADELARMNRDAIERAERQTALLVEVNRVLPILLERVAEVTKLAKTRPARVPATKKVAR